MLKQKTVTPKQWSFVIPHFEPHHDWLLLPLPLARLIDPHIVLQTFVIVGSLSSLTKEDRVQGVKGDCLSRCLLLLGIAVHSQLVRSPMY